MRTLHSCADDGRCTLHTLHTHTCVRACSRFMQRGASIQFISAFPEEEEVLFPPLTYLLPTKKEHEVIDLVAEGMTITVVEVAPQR